MYQYAYLTTLETRIGKKWDFNGKHIKKFDDYGLIEVLNELGKDEWELTTKNGDHYILKRKVQ